MSEPAIDESQRVPAWERVAVWPLRQGLSGYDVYGFPCLLEAGRKGWMHRKDAGGAQKRGEVQVMVGLDSTQLAEPDYSPREPKRKRGRPPRKKPEA